MASNSSLSTTVYNFDATGNKFKSKQLQAIPLPAEFVPATSPDPAVFVYSKIIYREAGGSGMLKEAYTAETVAQLITKANA